jgi:hypothetical protein
MHCEELLDELIGIVPSHWQELALGLIGGQRPPGTEEAIAARRGKAFKIGFARFTEEQVAQQLLEGGRIKIELQRFLPPVWISAHAVVFPVACQVKWQVRKSMCNVRKLSKVISVIGNL